MKKHFFRLKLFEYDPSFYFLFALTISEITTKRMSFSLELFSCRIIFFEYKRLLRSDDKADVFSGETIYKPYEVPQSTFNDWKW